MDFLATLVFTLTFIFIISGEINSTYPFVRLDDLKGRQNAIERPKTPTDFAMSRESGGPSEPIKTNESDGNIFSISI